MKDKTIAALLGILIGGLGIHHFYLGNTTRGIIYVLCSWIFYITGIIGFIEGVYYLIMDQEEFDARYNNGIPSESSLGYSPRPSRRSVADELEKLHDLKEKGILTEDEYYYKKDQLLR